MKKLVALLIITVSLLEAFSFNSFSSSEKESFLEKLKNSNSSLYKSQNYKFKKGWNIVTTPKAGVDVPKTFDISTIKLVVAYDYETKLWAKYSPLKSKSENGILFLKYLEPNVTFFVLAKRATTIEIKSKEMSQSCKQLMHKKEYNFLLSGVYSKENSKTKSMEIQTRYLTHYERGFYDDTRVVLIYPNIDTNKKPIYKYGPASPRISLKFAKEYEGKKFYVYDYKFEKCYQGYFPSEVIPPYPILEEI